jgi:uncharacterized protein (TIGR02217 family)
VSTDPLFVNERLPEDIEQGAKGGPGFKTTVLELSGGSEARNSEWSRARATWDIGYGMQEKEDMDRVLSMFVVCMGKAHGFRFKDFSDYEIGAPGSPQQIAVAAGETVFQANRLYTVGSYSFSRKVTRLVAGTVFVYINGLLQTEGTDYTVGYDTGKITFAEAPPTGHGINLIAEFDVPVRFDTDSLSIEVTWENAESVPQIVIKELKE